ncbi:MAG: hypothetical protein OXC60_01550 [Litoreibacter sp.]|nr:hypothetical protein [Litoreibacter sp.]
MASVSPSYSADVARWEGQDRVASISTDSDAIERLRLVDRLPMLTQRAAAASCALSAGIDIEANRGILKASSRDMGAVLRALTVGNPYLNVANPEPNRRILNDLDLLAEAWGYTKSAIYGRLAGRDDAANAELIASHSDALFAMATELSADLYGRYVRPIEIKQSDAMALFIAARQAQLMQQIALDACEIWAGHPTNVQRERLETNVELFSASLTALRGGLSSAGLQAAPTPEIEAALTRRAENWAEIKGSFFSGDAPQQEMARDLLRDLNTELSAIEELVAQYASYAARQL